MHRRKVFKVVAGAQQQNRVSTFSYVHFRNYYLGRKTLNSRSVLASLPTRSFSSVSYTHLATNPVHDVLQHRTRSILKDSDLHNPHLWQRAMEVCQEWVESAHLSPQQRLNPCLDIMDHLSRLMKGTIKNTQESAFASILMDVSLWNRILALWKQLVLQDATSAPTPNDMAQRLDLYQWTSLVQPNVHSYNILFETCRYFDRKEGAQVADTILRQLIQLGEDYYDHRSITCVIHAWKRLKDAPRAHQWWTLWKEQHPSQPTLQAYTMVLQAWAEQGNITQAQAIFDDWWETNSSTAPVDTAFYNALLAAHAKAPSSMEPVEHLLDEMQQRNHEYGWKSAPDVITFSYVLQCRATLQGPKLAEAALHDDSKSLPHPLLLNTVLKAYSQRRMGREAQRLLLEYPVRDAISFETVLTAWSRSNDVSSPQQVQALMEQMVKEGIPVTIRAYASLLQCYSQLVRRKQDPEPAWKADTLLQHLYRNNLQPNTICHHIVLTAQSRIGNAKRCIEWLERWEHHSRKYGQPPTSTAYRLALYAVDNSQKPSWKDAKWIWERLYPNSGRREASQGKPQQFNKQYSKDKQCLKRIRIRFHSKTAQKNRRKRERTDGK